MKTKRTYHFCEYCNTPIEDISPPTKEMYDRGQIHIHTGSMLLPEVVAKRRTKPGYSTSHSVNIDGYYCSYKCLIAKLEETLNPELQEEDCCKEESIGIIVEVIKRQHSVYHGPDTDGCGQHCNKCKD